MLILPVWFIYVAATMRLVGGVSYFLATLNGKARPHAISWLIWSVTPMITFFAEASAGVGPIAIVTLALAISPMMVFVAALVKDRSLLRVNHFDIWCLTLAVFGIVSWGVTREPITAIIIAIMADAISCLPTLRKAYHRPYTEHPPTFLLSASSMVIALLATQEISFAAFAFPVYVLTVNLLFLAFSVRRYSRRYARLAGRKQRHRYRSAKSSRRPATQAAR